MVAGDAESFCEKVMLPVMPFWLKDAVRVMEAGEMGCERKERITVNVCGA